MFAKQPKFEVQPRHQLNGDVACLRVTSMGPPIASQFDGYCSACAKTMTFRAFPVALA